MKGRERGGCNRERYEMGGCNRREYERSSSVETQNLDGKLQIVRRKEEDCLYYIFIYSLILFIVNSKSYVLC